MKDRLYFYGSYYRPDEDAGQPRQPLRRAAVLREHAERGLRKADLHPHELDPPELQLSGVQARGQERPVPRPTPPPPPAPATRRASRSAPPTDRGSSTPGATSPSSTPTSRNPTQGRPDNVADVDLSTAVGTRLDIANLDTQGLFTVPVPDQRPECLQRVRAAPHRPLRLRPERQAEWAAAPSATPPCSTTTTSRGTPGRSPTTSPSAARVTHDLHVGYQFYEDAEDLTRSSNGWGSISAPGGTAPASSGTPIFYSARLPAADHGPGAAPSTPNTGPRASS